MKLTHNPASGHIKQDGAVVGIVKQIKRDYVFSYYKFDTIECSAKTLEKLLPKVRKLLEKR